MENKPFIHVQNLKKHFFSPSGTVHAVDGVNFSINKGTTLGLVGESGCGKSTIGKLIVKLDDPTAGDILIRDKSILNLNNQELVNFRQTVQIIFQDPFSSLNPRLSVFDLIAEPIKINAHGSTKREDLYTRVRGLMDRVGLSERVINFYPHELDGGRRQRIGVARALALEPEFIVLDEPVSALDVSIQAQIINLLEDLQEEDGLTYLFISHDLSVVKYISDQVCVMYLGQIVESADSNDIFDHPVHPYTKALLSAVPIPRIDIQQQPFRLEGEVPSAINPPTGCRFRGRCPYATEECKTYQNSLDLVGENHRVACLKKDEFI